MSADASKSAAARQGQSRGVAAAVRAAQYFATHRRVHSSEGEVLAAELKAAHISLASA